MSLFDEQLARKPNLYPWTQDFIDAIWNGFWTPNEFDFKADYDQFLVDLTEEERGVVVRTLSAIGQIEIAVKSFWGDLGKNLPHPGISDLGYAMANSEVIHNQAYEKLLDVLRMQDVFEQNLQVPVVKARVEYLRKYMQRTYGDNRKQYIYAIILFTLFVENCSLFSQFYVVMWFNRFKNVLKDTAQQVQYTRNEEMLHAQVGIKIINTLRAEYPELFDEELEAKVREEVREALACERRIIHWILGDYEGDERLNAPVLISYLAGRLNDSMEAIGFDAPFDVPAGDLEKSKWMDEETLGNTQTDFFQKKPVEYAKNNRSYNEEDLF